MITTNKTLLTQLSEDIALWSVYVTIENLDSETRRQRNHSSRIFLRLIFISKKSGKIIKNEVYHIALFIILTRRSSKLYIKSRKKTNILISAVVERYAKIDLSMRCADDQTRWCFFIIADFSINYEKQVLIINVKSRMHCSICQVSKNKQDDLNSHHN